LPDPIRTKADFTHSRRTSPRVIAVAGSALTIAKPMTSAAKPTAILMEDILRGDIV
jgi:hypothetical protein